MEDSDESDSGIQERSAPPPSLRHSQDTLGSGSTSASDDRSLTITEDGLLDNAQSFLTTNPQNTGKLSAIKWFTRLGSYPIKACIRDLQAIVHHKQSGPAFVTQSVIHLLGTIGTGISGGYLECFWPSLSDSIYAMTDATIGFLGDSVVGGSAYVANVLVMAAIGAKVGDIVLSYLMNKILSTPHTELHFSDSQLEKIAIKAGYDSPDREVIKDIRNLTIVLQQLYKIKDQKYQGLAKTRENQKLLKAAQRLRVGDLTPLMKRLKEEKAKKSIAVKVNGDNQRARLAGTIAKQALVTAKRIYGNQTA